MEFDLRKISESDRAEISKALALNTGGDNSRVDSKEEYEKLGELLSGAAKGSETAKYIEQLMFDGLESTLVSSVVREAVADMVKYGDDTKADLDNEIAMLKKLKQTKGLSEFDKLYIEKIIKGHEITKINNTTEIPAKPKEDNTTSKDTEDKGGADAEKGNASETDKEADKSKKLGNGTNPPNKKADRKQPGNSTNPTVVDRKKEKPGNVNSNNGNGNTTIGNGTHTGDGGTTVIIGGDGNTVNIGAEENGKTKQEPPAKQHPSNPSDGCTLPAPDKETDESPANPSDGFIRKVEEFGRKIADYLKGLVRKN